MTSTVQFIPTAAEDYDTASVADNAYTVDYDFENGLGYTATVAFDLPSGITNGLELREAIETALDQGNWSVHVKVLGPDFPDPLVDMVARGYLEAAAFCGVMSPDDDGGESVEVDVSQFDDEVWTEARVDVRDFMQGNATDCREYLDRLGAMSLGSDFFLTRNGHGAGFWDRGLGTLGDRLTEASRPYGETYFWLRSDGSVGA